MNAFEMSRIEKICFSSLIIALYVSLIFLAQGISYGAIQVRVATCLYALGYLFPFLPFPLFLANVISNLLFGGLGSIDILGGGVVGYFATRVACIMGLKRLNEWNLIFPIVLIPGLLVPTWLSIILNIPYFPLAISVCLGQIIPSILGVLLIKRIKSLHKIH